MANFISGIISLAYLSNDHNDYFKESCRNYSFCKRIYAYSKRGKYEYLDSFRNRKFIDKKAINRNLWAVVGLAGVNLLTNGNKSLDRNSLWSPWDLWACINKTYPIADIKEYSPFIEGDILFSLDKNYLGAET
jgi:hypothetical protein